MTKRSARSAGFTLVEILVIAPVVILAIGGFVALMTSMVGDIMAARESNKLTYETQDSLNRIEQDIRLSTQFLTTTGALTTPQGSNDGSTAYTNASNTLILTEIATDKNPVDTTRQPIYYANQPNPCGGTQTANQMYLTKVVYFIKGGSLWRRTILPAWNTNAAIDGDTICSPPWQQNSCSPGYSTGNQCQTNDVEVMKRVTSLSVQYFSTPDGATDLGAAGAANASTVKVTIGAQATTAGRASNSSESVRATKLNGVVTTADTAPLSVIVQPSNVSTIPSDHSVSFTSQASSSAATVQWQRSDDGGTTWANIAGATGTTITVPTLNAFDDGAQYRAVFTRGTNTTTSSGAVLTVPMWKTLALQNGWAFYSAPYATAAYTQTSYGEVYLKGLIKNGPATWDTKIATLPAGMWPADRLTFYVGSDTGGVSASGRIDVLTNGEIHFMTGNNGWISLDNIHFMPSGSCTFTDLVLTNGWLNYGGGYPNLSTCQDASTKVHTIGLVKSGVATSGTPIGTLPVNLQPSGAHIFPGIDTGTSYNAFGVYKSNSSVAARGQITSYLGTNGSYYPSAYAGWNNLTLQNGWVYYGGSFALPQYTKSADGVVTLQGLIKSGTTTADVVLTNLPAGYRPKARLILSGDSGNNHCRLDVLPNGDVYAVLGANSGYLSLSNITFIAEQ